MPDILKARDNKDVEDAVLWALGNERTLEVVGRASKRALGRPSQSDATLDLSALSGITLYEPEELVLSARAGTPIAEIEERVAQSHQELSFEPIDYGPVFGCDADAGSIGGVLAANLAGPRRIKAGAARDHFLGFSAVSGRGETFKSGGRVVKNVTGYDLCKLMAGSFGTLAVMTDVTIKTLPRAETETSVLIEGLDAVTATQAMSVALGSSGDVSGAAHLPADIAARCAGISTNRPITALRLEGVAPSVAHRRETMTVLMKTYGAVSVLDEKNSRLLWRALRDVQPFAAASTESQALWRVSTAPGKGFQLAAQLPREAEVFYDWGGGLVWVALPMTGDAGAHAIRYALAALGGHATLIRASAALRAALEVFQPQEAGIAALTKRVKENFDPKGVLNFGRMWAGV